MAVVAVVAGITVLLLLLSFRLGLNGDVQYVLGSIRTGQPDGQPAPLDVFTHRPLVYRAFMAVMDGVGGTAVLDGEALRRYELALRVAAALLAAAASGVLLLGLRRYVSAHEAAAGAAGVGFALVLAPSWNFLQPEWLAAVAAVAGIGAALWLRDRRVAGGLAGMLLAIAVWAKLATLPYALAALLLVAVLDRRRALSASIGTAAWGLVLGLATILNPFEVRWLRDIAALDLGNGLGSLEGFATSISALASEAAVAPLVVVLPAAVVLLVRLAKAEDRWRLAVALTAAAVLLIAPLVIQGKGYLYHLTGLPVLAGGLVGLALARLWGVAPRAAIALAAATAAVALATWWLVSQPVEWRLANVGTAMLAVYLGCIGVAILAARVSLTDTKPHASDRATVLVVLVVVLALAALPAVAPASAWSLDPGRTTATNRSWAEATDLANRELSELRKQIGPETPVLYLAWGNVPYHLGNPTPCRYPAALFIRVLGRLEERPTTASFAENVDCIRHATEPWLVMDPAWIRLTQMRPGLRRLINGRYDCSGGLRAGDLLACPRRSAGSGLL